MNEFFTSIGSVWNEAPLWAKSVLVLFCGVIGALLMRFIVGGFLRLIRFDKFSDRSGVTEFLRKGGVKYTASQLCGVLSFWLVLIVSFVWASSILDIEFISALLSKLAEVLPGVIAAILVGIVGWIVIVFSANFAITIARNAGFLHSELLGRVIRTVGIVLVLIMSLEQIEVGGGVLGTLLLIAFGSLFLGMAISFGIGCKDIAKDVAQKCIKNIEDSRRGGANSDLEG